MAQRSPISYVDSHTEGEPTRVVIAGGPTLRGQSVQEMAEDFRNNYDWFRSAVVQEPRGSDVLVGALLVASSIKDCACGVIYFNNAGVLGMCGHGTIGLVRTLAHLGKLSQDAVRIETPVGVVTARIVSNEDGSSSVEVANVRSFLHRSAVELLLEDGRIVHGDIAWGGNGFFLCEDHGEPIHLDNLARLQEVAGFIRTALAAQKLDTIEGHPVDHVELMAPASTPRNHGRNFVLCPGGAYDRSPCGTGTSAKLACLAAHGTLSPGEVWRQESIIGSVFEAWYEQSELGGILPVIRGRAWITAQGLLHFDDADPYRDGITAKTVA